VITINIDPMIFSFGHLMVRWYGLIVMAAIAAGVWVASREARRKGLAEADLGDAILWVIMAGLVGARLFHVIDHWPDGFAVNPLRALYIWEGGLAIWGAVIGGLIALTIYARRRGLRLAVLVDTIVPGLVLGQAIGRLACIITGDAIGKPTTGPIGFRYLNPSAMVPQLGVYYVPTPVFEIVMNLAIFGVLWKLRTRRLPDGALFLAYLILYSTGRFVVTFWSAYQTVAFGLNQAQLISIAGFALGLPALAYLLTQRRPRQNVLAGH
jgi:phosphatidylglycerol---prolipoprotein diacylglyceryl transferase